MKHQLSGKQDKLRRGITIWTAINQLAGNDDNRYLSDTNSKNADLSRGGEVRVKESTRFGWSRSCNLEFSYSQSWNPTLYPCLQYRRDTAEWFTCVFCIERVLCIIPAVAGLIHPHWALVIGCICEEFQNIIWVCYCSIPFFPDYTSGSWEK